MWIPSGAIIPLFIASFVMLAFQYFHLSPTRRILNLRFLMMGGAVVLMMFTIMLTSPLLSVVYLVLALFWAGYSYYLLRTLPPPKH